MKHVRVQYQTHSVLMGRSDDHDVEDKGKSHGARRRR